MIFLPQCHSTNEVAKELCKNSKLSDGSTIWTDYQEKGKGQQGNVWLSERAKNLLFTVLLKLDNFPANSQFKITMLLSVALQSALQSLIPTKKVEIKWPNDIYCNDKKMAGILIETNISGQNIEDVFCGIGLNVNQSFFQLPTATSLKMELNNEHDRTEVLEAILLSIERFYEGLFHGTQLEKEYLKNLRWLNEAHKFRIDGQIKKGTISGVTKTGKLSISLEKESFYFDLKEIEFLE